MIYIVHTILLIVDIFSIYPLHRRFLTFEKQRLEAMHDSSDESDGVAAPSDDSTPVEPARTWQISVRPHPDMLQSGNDPVRIFRELATLGELRSVADVSALPNLAELQANQCYISWQLELRGDISREQLAAVFDWALFLIGLL